MEAIFSDLGFDLFGFGTTGILPTVFLIVKISRNFWFVSTAIIIS
jgi:hypothetical protein